MEKIDIAEEPARLVELESLYHGPVDSLAEVKAESLGNLACFVSGASVG